MKKQYGLNKCVQFGWIGFLGGFCVSFFTTKTLAQQSNIIPDNTLGAESSRFNPKVVINGINADSIDRGARRGSNLFHSFSQFNINNGQSLYFVNPAGVKNILTRVTGGNASNILGTLGVAGGANLFLINPAGILFGENARLDVQGSFVGTTANGVQFGEQGTFSATNPEVPGLLTVNPNALFFNQIKANAGINNKSQAPAGINPNGNETTGLRVPDGKSLLLVGGNINLNGGRLRAYEGHLELASLVAPGTIGLDIFGNTFRLNIPNDVERGDVSLTKLAAIGVFGTVGGNIVINARNLEISNSFIFAGIGKNSENSDAQAGDINFNATGSILLKDETRIDNSVASQGNAGNIFLQASNSVSLVDSDIFNLIEAGGVGKGGNININAGSLSLTEDSKIQALLSDADVENNLLGGKGNAGNINIDVHDAVTIAGIKDGFSSTISSFVGTGAVGNAGDININADSLSLTEGSELDTRTFGEGNAGDITVNARQNISLDGSGDVTLIDGSNGTVPTRIINSVNPEAVGNAGDIQLNTGTVSVTNGAFIGSGTNGKGNAGNIAINARNTVIFDTVSFAESNVFSGAVGKGGDIQITTRSLSVMNGASILSGTNGRGDAGNIIINARDTVTFEGFGGSIPFNSQAFTNAGSNSIGYAGDIRITTRDLLLKNGGLLQTSSSGQGNAGNIFLDVRNTITFDGVASNSLPSGALTSAVNGNAGNIEMETGSLFLTNGAQMSTIGFGQENNNIVNAGNITINARDTIKFDGINSGLSSSLNSGVGKGGDIKITTGSLSVTNGAQLFTATFARGNAGNININARDTVTFDQGSFASTVVLSSDIGDGGDIQITTGSLSVTNGARLDSSTFGKGDAGDIEINASDKIIIKGRDSNGFSSGVFSKVNLIGEGNGGEVRVITDYLFLENGGILSTETLGKGDAGKIFVDASDSVSLSNSSRINSSVSPGGEGKGGKINIYTQTLTSTGGSQITAAVSRESGNLPAGNGKGGEININASESVTLSGISPTGFSSGILTLTERGASGDTGNINVTTGDFRVTDDAVVTATTSNNRKAGNITINTNNFELFNGGRVATVTRSSGNAGTITLNVKDKITLSGIGQGSASGLFASTSVDSTGKGGSIFIDPRTLIIRNGATISVDSQGTGIGGNIEIAAGYLTLDRGSIFAETRSNTGGNITLNLQDLLLLRNGSQITTTAGNQQFGGDGGNITINSPFIVALPKEDSNISANAFSGRGGKVEINSQGIFGIESRPKPTALSDITASSQLGISGETNINTADTSSIQNSFTELSPTIDTSAIIANSCIARSNKRQENSFTITGSGALPANRPGDVLVSTYTTGKVRGVETTPRPWKKGDPIIEPQGLYRLNNGQLLLSRECSS